MPDVQPPEGLLPPAELIQTVALTMCSAEKGISHGSVKPCQWCRNDAAAALAGLFEACEVREESRVVLDDKEIASMWLPMALAGHDRFLAGNWPSARVERRFVIETEPEPVSSTGEEPTDG